MVRPVSLSDPAFAMLRSEKREGESDSDVILRVFAAHRASLRDPFHFVRVAPTRKPAMTEAEYDEFRLRMRDADSTRMKRAWSGRRGRA